MASEFWVDLWAGWVAGAASVLVVQPVDTTLTRMQAMRLAPGVDGSASAMVRRVLAEGGTRALWRGTTPMTAVIPVQNALLFAGYGAGERWMRRGEGNDGGEGDAKAGSANSSASLLPVFVGGVAGGVLQSFVVSPFELVKIKQQASGGAAVTSLRELGARLGSGVLTRGLGATLLRDGIPHGVWFVAYEWSKQRLSDALVATESGDTRADSQAAATAVPVCAGAFAAAVAWGVGYPADLVKTRVQAAATAAGALAQPPGLAATAAAMLRECNGSVLRAFYRGFDLKLLRAVPASAVSFFAYEEARRWLESK